MRLDDTAGPWAALLARPNGVTALLRSARGPVSVSTEVEGGVRLRHARFLAGTDQVDVWLDGRDRVQRATVTSERAVPGGRWHSVVSVALSDFGVAVPRQPLPTAAATAPAPAGESVLVYPLGASVAASLVGRYGRPAK
jgi:hypothetical protein